MSGKSCLVLDLDSTLIHTFGDLNNWEFVSGEESSRKQKRIFTIDFEVNDRSLFMWGTKCNFRKTLRQIF